MFGIPKYEAGSVKQKTHLCSRPNRAPRTLLCINPSDVDILEQCVSSSLPQASYTSNESDFAEAHDDPAQSEELERQQDA
jgi:hypothetical protein